MKTTGVMTGRLVCLFVLIMACVMMSQYTNATLPYCAFEPFDWNSYNLTGDSYVSCGYSDVTLSKLRQTAQKLMQTFTPTQRQAYFSFSSLLNLSPVASEEALRHYAEDYGHIVHQKPLAVFVPDGTQSLTKLVQRVSSLVQNDDCVKIKLVLRGASGNVEGRTQPVDLDAEIDQDPDEVVLQVLVDISLKLNKVATSVTVGTNGQKSLWADAGATWLSFVQSARSFSLRPLVVPDYLGITLGGSLSIGGIGGDSGLRGPCVAHVAELEIVTSEGQAVNVTETSPLFLAALGGMGQFGIITKVRINLDYNPVVTRVYHFVSTDMKVLLDAVNTLQLQNSNNNFFDTVQTFVVADQLSFIQAWVLNGRTTYRTPQEQEQVEALLSKGLTWIYLLEITKRYDGGVKSIDELALASGQNFDLLVVDDLPTAIWDERLYYFSLPALISTGAWYARHPWLDIYLSSDVFVKDETGKSQFDNLMAETTPAKHMGYGHIGLYPLLRSQFAGLPSISVPQSPSDSKWVYLLVLGRDEITGTDEGLNFQANHNRKIWDDQTNSVFQLDRPHASLYPSNMIPNFDKSDWQKHFGKCAWKNFVASKKQFDPNHIFADTRNFGFH